jgi:hypothetical protein
MSEVSDLALVPKENALQVFSAAQGLDPYLSKIRAEIDGFTPDVTSRKGREAIASIAHKVARSKTALDNIGKDLVAELKEVPKKIDAERKRMRDLLDEWKDEVRRPLTEWEDAEAARVERIQAQVSRLGDTDVSDMSAADIKESIDSLESHVIDARYEEFESEAHRIKASSLATLREALAVRQKYEAEQAELERLRAEIALREQREREVRIAREATERAQREAEQKAQAEREAVIRREQETKAAAERQELELRLRAEQAEREKVEAQRRAEQAERDAQARAEQAAAAERQRQADEAARIEREAAAREADRAHKGAILKAAKEAIMAAGITEDQAKAVIKLIAAGQVPSVSISY